MVDVAHNRQLKPDIDYHLDYQFGAWSSLADYANQWPALEDVDRETFQLEWEGITESRLRELQRWSDEGYLTRHQQVRLRRLLAIVRESRPTLRNLFAT